MLDDTAPIPTIRRRHLRRWGLGLLAVVGAFGGIAGMTDDNAVPPPVAPIMSTWTANEPALSPTTWRWTPEPPPPRRASQRAEPTPSASRAATSRQRAASTPHSPPRTTPHSTPRTTPRPATTDPAAPAVLYRTCREARDAHAAPLHEGDAGYSPHLDRDGDGVACEN